MNKEKSVGLFVIILAFLFLINTNPHFVLAEEGISAAQGATNNTLIILQSFQIAEKDIQEMEEAGFNTKYANDLLIEAKQSFYGENYTAITQKLGIMADQEKEVYLTALMGSLSKEQAEANNQKLLQLIGEIKTAKEYSFQIWDSINALKLKIDEYKKNGVNTANAEEKLRIARQNFRDELYTDAEKFVNEADFGLETAKDEISMINTLKETSKTFFEQNILQIITALLFISLLSSISYRHIKIYRMKRELENLKLEEQVLTELMKKAQLETFEKKTISSSLYEVKMAKYRERMMSIRRNMPVLAAAIQREGLVKRLFRRGKE
ncbi:hypothetical protein HY643_01940 [Candidatus Woesearchaeota archaeon]|nr:hypothetical protein [Candidatus Woesearchaeota archaeon]